MAIVLYTSEPYTYPGGAVAVGVPVRVYFADTAVNAAIYADSLGAVLKTNPTRTDNAGQVSFYIEPGTYDLLANGVRTTVTLVGPVDPPDADDFITLEQAQDLDATVLASANAHSDAQDGQTLASANASASGMVSALASSTADALGTKADATATANALAGKAATSHTHQASDIVNGAWTAPDLTGSAWTADTSGTYYSLAFRLEGDKTIGRGRVTLASPTNYVGGSRIMTLPVGCRPLATVVLDVRSGNTGASGGFFTIDPAGVLSYSASITNATGFIFLQFDRFGFYKGAL